jgi:hypothetical protein
MDQIIDLLDAAAKRYPIKALCDEIGKGESTLRNELTQQEGYKLGLITTILIMRKTGDLEALDRIEAMFNRAAFLLPAPDQEDVLPVMRIAADMAAEFGESLKALGDGMKDGRLTGKEAERCLKENMDLIKACVRLKAYLEGLR